MINSHTESWLGYDVLLFDEAKADEGQIEYDKYIFRLAIDYDSSLSIRDLFYRFLENPESKETPAIIIGSYHGDDPDVTSEGIVEMLVSARAQFPKLKAIFLGDIVSEENEISWINQSDISPLFSAYPQLEHFRVRGTNGLSFGHVRHPALKTLIVESGGLPRELLHEIAQCEFPNLEHLELWLGTDNYGGNATIKDVEPILKKEKYSKLQFLGLKNSDIEDELAQAVVQADILPQLEVLDLSLGILTDVGGKALLDSDRLSHLKKLDLHHHFLSTELQTKLAAKYPFVDVSDVQKEQNYSGEIYRYVSVGE